MYPSFKISTTALNDLLNNKVISTECLCCDYHLGLYTVEKYDPQHCIAFSWPAFMIEYRPSLNWKERIRVCLIMEQSGGWLCCALVVVLVFFLKKKCGGEKMGCF